MGGGGKCRVQLDGKRNLEDEQKNVDILPSVSTVLHGIVNPHIVVKLIKSLIMQLTSIDDA